MKTLYLAALAVMLVSGAAHAQAPASNACPIAGELALSDLTLPAARAAVAAKHLTILSLGGAASAGAAAHGMEFTYPARLVARLRLALPGVDITVASPVVKLQSVATTLRHLDADLTQTKPDLVIWGAGAIEAGSGQDIDTLTSQLADGVDRIQTAHADTILIDVQYAPSIARVINLEPYRQAVLRVGAATAVPVLDRYGLMLNWTEDGTLDFDVTDPQQRIEVARKLFDCLAEVLTAGIVPAVK